MNRAQPILFTDASTRRHLAASDRRWRPGARPTRSQPRLGTTHSHAGGRRLHCGAAVNWVFSYAGLRAANVARHAGAAAPGVPPPAARFTSSRACRSATRRRPADSGRSIRRAAASFAASTSGTRRPRSSAEALVREAGARTARPHLPAGADLRAQRHRRLQPRRPHRDARPRLRAHGHRAGSRLEARLRAGGLVATRDPALVRSGRAASSTSGILRPRHWRECVLWMRMYGYDVRLVSYPRLAATARTGDVGTARLGAPRIRSVRCGRSFSSALPARAD